MSQIDEIIKNYIGIMPCVGCEELKEDDLKRFASEVCKAMIEDCLPEEKPSLQYSWNDCINEIKERAEKWVK